MLLCHLSLDEMVQSKIEGSQTTSDVMMTCGKYDT
jgi:hypothetical protein